MLPGTDIMIGVYSKSRTLVERPVRKDSSAAWLLRKAVDIDVVRSTASSKKSLLVVVTQI